MMWGNYLRGLTQTVVGRRDAHTLPSCGLACDVSDNGVINAKLDVVLLCDGVGVDVVVLLTETHNLRDVRDEDEVCDKLFHCRTLLV